MSVYLLFRARAKHLYTSSERQLNNMLTKPRERSKPLETSLYTQRRRRLSPLMLIGIIVPAVLLIAAGSIFAWTRFASHAAAVNPNCSLRLPANPLSAKGLATPYQLSATDPAQGPCNEANAGQSAFVQAVIFDPNTNTLSAYEPLVIDQGTQPAVAPMAPILPKGAVVGIWFGFNGTFLHLIGDTRGGRCVNGLNGSDFGQFAYCNAPRFFRVANAAIAAKTVTVPAIGTANDGQSCLTTRDFALVDMDQSDNVQSQYLANAQGQTAQFSTTNQNQLQNATTISNPSDNALLSRFVDPALGCQSWQIPDLVNNGAMTATMATDELQAAANQKAPIALVPSGDEMVLVGTQPSLAKVNAYRMGVDQPLAANANDASTTAYCTNLINVALPRLQLDMKTFQAQPSPDGGATANSLFTFLANRLNGTLSANGLNCVGLLNIQNPVTLTTDGNGVVTSATLTIQGTGTGGTGTGGTGGTGNGTAPNCTVNGTAIPGCTGTTTINGQTCTFAFTNGTVSVTCPAGTGTGTGGTGTSNPNPLPFNNASTSLDTNANAGNFDGVGCSYSAQALQNAGITPGKMLTFNGVPFYWPASAPGTPDNVQAQGQTIPVTPAKNATTLAFLGASSFGPAQGETTGDATITYTDGSTQAFTLGFSDWTLVGGAASPVAGEQVVISTPYRNTLNGIQMSQMPNVFYTSVDLQAGKTIKSVTLPTHSNNGQLHVFAIGTK